MGTLPDLRQGIPALKKLKLFSVIRRLGEEETAPAEAPAGGEAAPEMKNSVSHRGRAMAEFTRRLAALLGD